MTGRKDVGAANAVALALVLLAGFARADETRPILGVGLDPHELYQMVHKAKWSLDVPTVFACTSKRVVKTEDEMRQQVMAERYTLSQSVRPVDQRVEERTAKVLFRGWRRDRDTGKLVTTRGEVSFVKEDGVWRIWSETWADVSVEVFVSDGSRRDQNLPPVAPRDVGVSTQHVHAVEDVPRQGSAPKEENSTKP